MEILILDILILLHLYIAFIILYNTNIINIKKIKRNHFFLLCKGHILLHNIDFTYLSIFHIRIAV